jgi:hypothetical protein
VRYNKANDVDFDCPFRVNPDGSITDDGLDNVHAPDLMDEEIDSDEWEFWTTGRSGQDHYTGPIMHNSEFIGGGLERDLLAEPGVYVVVVASWTPGEEDDPEEGTILEGWAILKLKGSGEDD